MQVLRVSAKTAEGMNAYMELLIQRANHRSRVAV
jgi:hypothetical protein